MKKTIFCMLIIGMVFIHAQDQRSRIDELDMRMAMAGKDLKDVRAYFYMATALEILGTTLIITNPTNDDDYGDSEISTTAIIGGILNLSGLVCYFISWHKIGQAGDRLATAEKRQQKD